MFSLKRYIQMFTWVIELGGQLSVSDYVLIDWCAKERLLDVTVLRLFFGIGEFESF